MLIMNMFLVGTARAETTKTTYYIPDFQGSPIAAMDEAGNIKWRKHYRTFGEEIEQDAASASNHIGYTGHVHDRDTGLTYMGARYYDPVVGRFMSMDPAGVDPNDPAAFNRYAYVKNSPYKYVDPDGNFAILLTFLPEIGSAIYTVGQVTLVTLAGLSLSGDVVHNENGNNDSTDNKDSGPSKDKSRSKRRAAREAQRKHGTPTSIPGTNQQGKPGTPRHQIKPGLDGKPDGVVDGSNDNVDGHGPHIEVGDLKSEEPINKYGQPRLKNGKSKVDY